MSFPLKSRLAFRYKSERDMVQSYSNASHPVHAVYVLLHAHIYIQIDICEEIKDWVKFSTRWHFVPTMHAYIYTNEEITINQRKLHALISFSQRQRRWRRLQRYSAFWLCAVALCWMKMHRNCIVRPYPKRQLTRCSIHLSLASRIDIVLIV